MSEINKANIICDVKSLIAKSGKPYDMEVIDKATNIAVSAHEGQKRSSGEEYVCHPLSVAAILIELGMDSETIAAAILHDVVEDTKVELDEITKEFGKDVSALVDGVTKLSKLPFSTKEEQQAENVRKMLLAMAQDIRVIIIKLADRLHNMRTIESLPEQKRRDKAKETMDIYAPLAHRLGIRAVKEELEDLSLRILDSVAYDEIEEALALREGERNTFIENIKQRITGKLQSIPIECFVAGRIKSITGIYRKMYIQSRSFDEIYDIYAVRVIVDSVNDCYNVLGIIHDMFRPIPNRFKDYISTPKSNMYQSLHTTVITKEKIPFEVQIRSWEMHYTAEYGIAAHWKYKLGIQRKDKLEEKLAWIRQFIENQKDVDDAEDIVRSIKTDLSSDDVFVFTPKGDVITLPVGATVIDFAYAIHSAVGSRMIGAKVDGRIVPIDYEVKTGEIVEVLTTSAQGHGPSRDWLNIVKTGEARNKIRSWFKKERREENIQQGKSELQRELLRNGIRLPEEKMQEFMVSQSKKQHCNTLDDFFAAIGYGGIILSRIMARVKEDYMRLAKSENVPDNLVTATRRHYNNGGVIIENMDNCLVKFARCCNPVPGDDIIGYITRGYGVSIHKTDCVNVPKDISASPEPERWVTVQWEDSIRDEFKATLTIEARNRNALLLDVTTQLASMRVMIHAMSARENQNGSVFMNVTVGVNSLDHLQSVISRLLQVPGIFEVTRSGYSG
ncbi:MAG: bifunctional (p)ppGpp synthetase/guanosine-3',5'-bis(diphosphate) 3'-pyrophosphohydrolase [Oscillospiraceae bacterium]|nr:bifunctional (p)ppGpp synthetase/guanosine-3',5'-bis(diphosphate) 3'-pyrophosphohydrolase [Oscillospiraceae bacterium]MDD3832774.1 bifunctional (p)ppGpp synthetase/guanosine-3',5'-bis(diphosphate) 3'-pyrophosphohydrolase [Oscillospiraceae bacterium]MDD4546324.1 bifunctional (p)ppGpp synthetase/guanosine-3',5'-bis(diphosphate) 3'-pyrophosphohydrolase [Oscillospiraceae bacterium]